MSCKIYVGNLSSRADERDLEETFDRYGKVKRADVKNGFGFVEFYDPRDAKDAIRGEDGRELLGRRMQVEYSRGGRDRGSGGGGRGARYKYRVTVTNLDQRTSWQDLKDFARKAGDVAYTDVSQSRGKKVGVIEYTNREDMEYALRKLDNTKLDGMYVRLEEEGQGRRGSRSPKRSRSRSRSRSRGKKSRSRSRSRSRSKSAEKKDAKESEDAPKDDAGKKKSRSRSRSRSKSRSKDRSKSRSKSKSKSRSRSKSK